MYDVIKLREDLLAAPPLDIMKFQKIQTVSACKIWCFLLASMEVTDEECFEVTRKDVKELREFMHPLVYSRKTMYKALRQFEDLGYITLRVWKDGQTS